MINRINYEEFFLLYVDDELNHHERTAVELFVQQNPDLLKEFEMLLEAKLGNEPAMQFTGKSSLIKKESIAISTDNHEEFFLLYADKELSEEDKKEVERFVLQHPRLQQEFTLLMQTILPVEAIAFKDKKNLYRKARERRIIPLYFARIAVAAAFIGLTALVWWLAPSSKTNEPTAVSLPAKKSQPLIKQQDNNPPVNDQVTPKNEQVATVETTVKKKDDIAPGKLIPSKNQQPVKQNMQEGKNDIAVHQAKNPAEERHHVQPETEGNNIIAKNDIDANKLSPTTSQTGISNEMPIDNAKDIFATNNDNSNTNIVQPAAYKILNTDDEDRSMYVGSLELNKDRVRGLFKKAGRIFSRKNNGNDNGKLQVANMQINTN